ncbi:MAG: hypothetical protein AAGC71_04960 [Pseudomonadota bacterium]
MSVLHLSVAWISSEIALLLVTAASIGVVHTLIGPDHYLPFVALARERGWSLSRTLNTTALCGIGHCAGSVIIGFVGIAFGLGIAGLEATESTRGDIAAWVLLGFAIAYLIYSLRVWRRSVVHSHEHAHTCGTVHEHEHNHLDEHGHVHVETSGATPVVAALFVVFVLGPCEALIPMLMYPAATLNAGAVLAVTLTFSFATVATMLIAVAVGYSGAKRFSLKLPVGAPGAIAATLIGACAAAMLLGL